MDIESPARKPKGMTNRRLKANVRREREAFMNETDKNQWGAAMERREHERTYESFLVLLKWSIIGIVAALVVVAIAMSR